MLGLWPLLLQLGALAPALAIKNDGPPGTEEYYWPKRAGTYIGHGAVPFDVPVDFSRKPAWTWGNPEDEMFRHGPVIDGEKNIYAVTAAGWVRKFGPDGDIIWSWRATTDEGKIVVSPFLYKGKLYLSTMGPNSYGHNCLVHCFDLQTGRRLWKAPMSTSGHMWQDSSTLHVAEDIMLAAMVSKKRPWRAEGNNMIFGMNATDGSQLWEFTLYEGVVWNFMPSTPGDGTFLFSTSCGRAERRHMSNGSLIWQSPVRDMGDFCSTGGGTLGPDGVFYVEVSHTVRHWSPERKPPLPGVPECSHNGCPNGAGLLIAYRAEDGEVLWANRIRRGFDGWQYPAVGKIDGRLAVVAAIGTNPALALPTQGPAFFPFVVRAALARLLYYSEYFRRWVNVPVKRNAIAAYDAKTGQELWLWEEEPWGFYAGKGDEGPLWGRISRTEADPRYDTICGPDNWGIPSITADGTVIAGSGNTGKLYAIRDANKDGVIQDSEVNTFDAEQGFLNGPALAPGMMAVAPCWGPMYVFKSGAK